MSGQLSIAYAEPIGAIAAYVAEARMVIGTRYEIRGHADGYDVLIEGRKTRRFFVRHDRDASDPSGWSFVAKVIAQADID